MKEMDTLNIPAYQRKRSLAAKARKKPVSLEESMHINIPKPRITKTRARARYPEDMLISDILTDIPAHTPLRSAEEFDTPEISYPSQKTSTIREMKLVGQCDGYFDKIDVAIITLTNPLRIGDQIIFEKENGLFEQQLQSMQINRKDVKIAHSGDDIGMKVIMKPKVGGQVYKVI